MKRRWLIPLLLIVVVGVAGFGLTGEKAQEVQKMSAKASRAENIGCRTMELNPLREEAYPELSEVVRAHYEELGKNKGFVEAYENVRVYTKLGKDIGSYVAFVTYEMKIKDIYTKVPGLGTFYIEKNGTSGEYEIKPDPGKESFRTYVALLGSHEDVKTLLEETNTAYEAAVNSDALLREALLDLKNAYEDGSR